MFLEYDVFCALDFSIWVGYMVDTISDLCPGAYILFLFYIIFLLHRHTDRNTKKTFSRNGGSTWRFYSRHCFIDNVNYYAIPDAWQTWCGCSYLWLWGLSKKCLLVMQLRMLIEVFKRKRSHTSVMYVKKFFFSGFKFAYTSKNSYNRESIQVWQMSKKVFSEVVFD